MKLPKLSFKLPFKLPTIGKREQEVLEKVAPIAVDVAVDAAKEQVQPNAPKRDARWYAKLAVLLGLAVAPVLVDAYPDATWDDALLAGVGLVAAILGVQHARKKHPNAPLPAASEPPKEGQ